MTDYNVLKAIRNGCEYDFSSGNGGVYLADILAVGGGGSGGSACPVNGEYIYGGGGGAGGVVEEFGHPLLGNKINITIGKGGVAPDVASCEAKQGNNGGDTVVQDVIAYGGGGGGVSNACIHLPGKNGASGGGGGAYYVGGNNYIQKATTGGCAIYGNQGYDGGDALCCCTNTGWYAGQGGSSKRAGGPKISCNLVFCGYGSSVNGEYYSKCLNCGCAQGIIEGRNTRIGFGVNDIPTNKSVFGVGGGYYRDLSCTQAAGYGYCNKGYGGRGVYAASTGYKGGNGGDGIVKIQYPLSGEYGFNCAEGGTKEIVDGYYVHTFTDDGTFTICGMDNTKKIYYTVVGGGAASGTTRLNGGGGGAVCSGQIENPTTYSIVVGCGGEFNTTACNGGASCIGNVVVANGGNGTTSGSGCVGGNGCYNPSYTCHGGGGGGGAGGKGCNGAAYTGGMGGPGINGYGGGGGGYGGYYGGCGQDGGGNGCGACCGGLGTHATNYGGGGGAWACNGYQGVVFICYVPGSINATGGDCCYMEKGLCVHKFTSDGTFTITS